MTSIKQKFIPLNLSSVSPSVKIDNDTQSYVLDNEVVQATPFLTLTDVLYIPWFFISLMSINQFTKHNNCKITFFPSHCVFQDLSTGKMIGSGISEEIYTIWTIEWPLLACLQVRLIQFYSSTSAWVIFLYKSFDLLFLLSSYFLFKLWVLWVR